MSQKLKIVTFSRRNFHEINSFDKNFTVQEIQLQLRGVMKDTDNVLKTFTCGSRIDLRLAFIELIVQGRLIKGYYLISNKTKYIFFGL